MLSLQYDMLQMFGFCPDGLFLILWFSITGKRAREKLSLESLLLSERRSWPPSLDKTLLNMAVM